MERRLIMTQEDKQLLLKDLCARLPYGLKVSVSGDDFDSYQYPYLLTAISKFGQDILCRVYYYIYTPLGCPSIENVKPYLRPMSSMTEEEKEEARNLVYATVEFTDWCNEHHLDYRHLIEKGLAVDAPKGMYKTE